MSLVLYIKVVKRVQREDREKLLCDFLQSHQLEDGRSVAIGYAFYDYDLDGTLDVLKAPEFPGPLREFVTNLKDLS